MAAPSSTELNTSDPNYQAMLTTEPLDNTNIVDVPADLSTPFDYLTNSDTDVDNADLHSARRWAWYCKDPACPKYWSAWSCKSNFWLHPHETAVHRVDVRTHTRVGHRELAREWRVETDWEMKEPKQPKPAPAQNGTASGNEKAAVA
jgi:hypothetical protein